MKSPRGLAALVLFAATLSCGGKSFDGSDAGTAGSGAGGTTAGGTGGLGGEGAGGTGSGGSHLGGSGMGGAGASGGNGGSAGAPIECTRFDDEASVAIEVAISNETFKPIHLGPTSQTCDTVPLFSVEDARGQRLPGLSWCRNSCQVLRKQGAGGCVALCPATEVVTLQPGESLYTIWDGHYRVDGQLPSGCVSALTDAPSSPLMCDQAKAIRAGTYTFRAEAGTSFSCAADGACNPCVPDPQGGCKTAGGLVTGTLKAAVTIAELSPTYGALTLPLPGNPGAGAAPEPIPTPMVRLVFTE